VKATHPAAAATAAAGTELQVVAAAREIADGELVFAATPLARLAFHLAKLIQAPRAIALDESGVVRHHPAPAPLLHLADPPNLSRASMLADLQGVMSLLQQGRVDLGLLEVDEVDRWGNIHSASGSATDIACLARRTVILIRHEPHRLIERVLHVTGPGHGDGQTGAGEGESWRRRMGVPGGGPVAIITDLATFRFHANGEAYLASLHPGVTMADLPAATGWKLEAAPIPVTPPPSTPERNRLAELDPEGLRTGAPRSVAHTEIRRREEA
jgi:glutaconate CoA-transferase subunit B